VSWGRHLIRKKQKLGRRKEGNTTPPTTKNRKTGGSAGTVLANHPRPFRDSTRITRGERLGHPRTENVVMRVRAGFLRRGTGLKQSRHMLPKKEEGRSYNRRVAIGQIAKERGVLKREVTPARATESIKKNEFGCEAVRRRLWSSSARGARKTRGGKDTLSGDRNQYEPWFARYEKNILKRRQKTTEVRLGGKTPDVVSARQSPWAGGWKQRNVQLLQVCGREGAIRNSYLANQP